MTMLALIIFAFGAVFGGALTVLIQNEREKMKPRGFFKLIPIAGLMMVIAGIIGIVLYFAQNGWADDRHPTMYFQDDIMTTESRGTEMTVGEREADELKPTGITAEKTDLSEIQKVILRDWYYFNASSEYNQSNVFDILAQLSKDDVPDDRISELLDNLEGYVRILRKIQENGGEK